MKKETMWLLGGGALLAFLLLRKPAGASRMAANRMPYPEEDRILAGTNMQRVGASHGNRNDAMNAFRGSRNDTTGGVRNIASPADSPPGGYYIDDTGNSENYRLI